MAHSWRRRKNRGTSPDENNEDSASSSISQGHCTEDWPDKKQEKYKKIRTNYEVEVRTSERRAEGHRARHHLSGKLILKILEKS